MLGFQTIVNTGKKKGLDKSIYTVLPMCRVQFLYESWTSAPSIPGWLWFRLSLVRYTTDSKCTFGESLLLFKTSFFSNYSTQQRWLHAIFVFMISLKKQQSVNITYGPETLLYSMYVLCVSLSHNIRDSYFGSWSIKPRKVERSDTVAASSEELSSARACNIVRCNISAVAISLTRLS